MADDDGARRELAAHERRLAALCEKAALLGYAADPATTLEIADIEQAVAALRQRLSGAPAGAAPALATPPATGGDTITATISGSSHVVVGKQISQHFGSSPPATDDAQALAAALDTLAAALAGSPALDAGSAAMAAFQVGLLRGELLKPAGDGPPSANVITQVAEWLLAHAPASAPALGALFASPACLRTLAGTSPVALAWAQQRFAAPPH